MNSVEMNFRHTEWFSKPTIWILTDMEMLALWNRLFLYHIFKCRLHRKSDSLSELLKNKTKYKNCSKIWTCKKKKRNKPTKNKKPKSVILMHIFLLEYYAKLASMNWVSLAYRHATLLLTDAIVSPFIKCCAMSVYCFYFM